MTRGNMMRFRIWVDGHLRCTHWVRVDDPDGATRAAKIAAHQQQIATAADEAGQRWCVEVWDTDAPTDKAYIRMGTDPRVMRDPVALTSPGQLAAMLHRPNGG